ncbi:GDP-mannose 4,6-dehydratase [Candidatus Uhrbacteria bacterium]|nr:GDP-mannose 4,6-dehydratase [Candidatus Uhrbacteria bacterium]
MKRALITGIGGQDGSYLSELLLAKGYEVFGLRKEDWGSLQKIVKESAPDEVYNLGGVTDLKTAYAEPEMTWKVNYESVGILLDECLKVNPKVRFLQASSSEIFLPSDVPLNEESPRDWDTKNPYAKAKMTADRDFITRYREEKNVFACSAFLFNHDSPRRSEKKSVLRKIARAFVRIHQGSQSSLSIGNVELSRDWGFAGDYVGAMWQILQADEPDDFVIATGKLHMVREAIDIAAHAVKIDLVWQGEGMQTFACDRSGRRIVEIAEEFYRPAERYPKVGDSRKAEKVLGWKPTVDFRSLIEMMVRV